MKEGNGSKGGRLVVNFAEQHILIGWQFTERLGDDSEEVGEEQTKERPLSKLRGQRDSKKNQNRSPYAKGEKEARGTAGKKHRCLKGKVEEGLADDLNGEGKETPPLPTKYAGHTFSSHVPPLRPSPSSPSPLPFSLPPYPLFASQVSINCTSPRLPRAHRRPSSLIRY